MRAWGTVVVRYSTFLIRHWRLPDQRARIEIRHIRSGAVARLDSLGAILDWMIVVGEQQHDALPERQLPKESATEQ